jgi:hypothetical protein
MNPVTVADTRLDCSSKRHDEYGQGPGYIVRRYSQISLRSELACLLCYTSYSCAPSLNTLPELVREYIHIRYRSLA